MQAPIKYGRSGGASKLVVSPLRVRAVADSIPMADATPAKEIAE